MSQKFNDIELQLMYPWAENQFLVVRLLNNSKHPTKNKPYKEWFSFEEITGDYYDSCSEIDIEEVRKLYLSLKEYFEPTTTNVQE